MAIVFDPVEVEWEYTGLHFRATPHEGRALSVIRVGTRSGARRPGPLGTRVWTRWSSDPRFRFSSHARSAFYQEVRAWVYPHARIFQHGVHIHVRSVAHRNHQQLEERWWKSLGNCAVAQLRPSFFRVLHPTRGLGGELRLRQLSPRV